MPNTTRTELSAKVVRKLRLKFGAAAVILQTLDTILYHGTSIYEILSRTNSDVRGLLSPPTPNYLVTLRDIESSAEYRSLLDFPSFKRARKRALRVALESESEAVQYLMQQISKKNDASALRALIFLRVVLRPIAMYYARKSDPVRFSPPTAEERSSARSAAVKLRRFLKSTGIASLAVTSSSLERDLDKLIAEIDSQGKRPRKDDSYFERQYVAEVEAAINDAYRTTMPSVASDLAALIGYTPHHRNIARARSKTAKLQRNP